MFHFRNWFIKTPSLKARGKFNASMDYCYWKKCLKAIVSCSVTNFEVDLISEHKLLCEWLQRFIHGHMELKRSVLGPVKLIVARGGIPSTGPDRSHLSRTSSMSSAHTRSSGAVSCEFENVNLFISQKYLNHVYSFLFGCIGAKEHEKNFY